jgi:hydroxylamine reductase
MAAYAHHAYVLSHQDESIFAFMQESLAKITDENIGADELTKQVLRCGEFGVKVMALLDKANNEKYGNPEPSHVNIGTRKNPGILISGHDLKDMEQLLEQTNGTGVDIYTHGEMLPFDINILLSKNTTSLQEIMVEHGSSRRMNFENIQRPG